MQDLKSVPLCALIGFAVWLGSHGFSLAGNAGVETLRVMTFNVWSGETTPVGRAKLTEIIQRADADVIGIQELNVSAAVEISATLGFFLHTQSGGDIQILSRYPIVGQSPRNFGAEIELSPGQRIWLFNAHLAPYPYQPYDLRDGLLPFNEQAVIDAANAARGSQVTSYLSDMAGALASGRPIFFTGDFNEPSHLDWTSEAAAATARPYDIKVEYPASKRITDVGFIDSFRAVRPDEVGDPAYTWTPGAPPPTQAADEVHDRIDIVYHLGNSVFATGATTYGLDRSDLSTDVAIAGYNADHRAVAISYDFASPCFLVGDLNGDCQLTADDWTLFRAGQRRDLSGLTPRAAHAMGDLNGDYLNNHADFTLFKQSYIQFHASTGGAAAFNELVPEPASVATAAMCAAVLGCRRRIPPSRKQSRCALSSVA